jgi:hypothetical protein
VLGAAAVNAIPLDLSPPSSPEEVERRRRGDRHLLPSLRVGGERSTTTM